MATDHRPRIKTYIGATARKLRFQMRDPDTGGALDITDVVTAVISAKFDGVATYQIESASMTIEVGTDGWLYFYPTSAQVDTKGDLSANIRLNYASDLDYSNEFVIEVDNAYDSTV